MRGSWREVAGIMSGIAINATTAAEIVLANGGVLWYT